MIREEMRLRDLRVARRKTQQQLAESLHVQQGTISKLENKSDLYLSTLRRYIEAMGGKLTILAQFPDADIVLDNLAMLTEDGGALMEIDDNSRPSSNHLPAQEQRPARSMKPRVRKPG
jgi:transcriptional regulator with XRE-family HTH domain